MTGTDLVAGLERRGFDFFAGVPCSLIEDVIAALESHPRLPYIDAVREDIAVGLAGGAWLAGRRPAVLMQNSGLGTSLNALASFSLMYGLPALLLVTWRGYAGRDAPEHLLMGEITPGLLEALGISARVLTPDSIDADMDWARHEMDARMRPVALLVRPGVLEADRTDVAVTRVAPHAKGEVWRGRPLPPPTPSKITAGQPGHQAPEQPHAHENDPPLIPKFSRMQAITAVMKELNDELVVCANGYPSREACAVADRPQNFYMIGSMGLAAAIGLGLAVGQPARRVVVLDGDGNLLMSLGVLANVAALAPGNFIHCVLDNEAYGSTGNQRSLSSQVRLDRVARAAGYRHAAAVSTAEETAATIRQMLGTNGPHLLLAKVTRDEADVPRIAHTPQALRARFRAAAIA